MQDKQRLTDYAGLMHFTHSAARGLCLLLLSFSLSVSCTASDLTPAQAFRQKLSDVQVNTCGLIDRLLADDLEGSRHQRFILKLADGQTLLVAHNIDLAPRVPDLKPDARLCLYGEYEWNRRGGVVHWTHHDPDGRHAGGWLKYQGQVYQ